MNLEQVRNELAKRGGAIKAFALSWASIEGIVGELGVTGARLKPDVAHALILFGVPVKLMHPGEPEGVIV